MIEAHNKIIKYNYLYKAFIQNLADLEKVLPQFIKDFNNRPHTSLNGLTPNEAHSKVSLNKNQLTTYKQIASAKRRNHNQTRRCKHC